MVVGKEYVQFVKETFKLQGKDTSMDYLILGLLSEIGEVADVLKKSLITKKPYNKKDLIAELGDVAWYSTALALETRSPSQVAKIIDGVNSTHHDIEALKRAFTHKDFLMVYEVLRDLEDSSYVMSPPVNYRRRMEILVSFATVLKLELSQILKTNMEKLNKKSK